MYRLRKITASLCAFFFISGSGGLILPSFVSLAKTSRHESHSCCTAKADIRAEGGYLRSLDQCSMPCCGDASGPNALIAAMNGQMCAAGLCMNNPVPAGQPGIAGFRITINENEKKERASGVTIRIADSGAGNRFASYINASGRPVGAFAIHFNRDIFLSAQSYLI